MTRGGQRVSRSASRKRALDVLFEADVKGRDHAEVLTAHRERPDPPDPYAVTLVQGVIDHRAEIDALITEHARGWSLERMPHVDRNALRIGLVELLHSEDVPPKVAIDEAVELVKRLSTDDSPRFVNGLLAAVARQRGLLTR